MEKILAVHPKAGAGGWADGEFGAGRRILVSGVDGGGRGASGKRYHAERGNERTKDLSLVIPARRILEAHSSF